MVVGSDRIREFDTLLKKYNSVKGRHGFYNFNSIQVISAGERDADADDVSGMSASKMRAAAEKGDFDSFKNGVPTRNNREIEQLYKDVRKGMGIAEGTLPQYMQEDLITEGVYDPGIFKAVFLMGGPGSGKSTVVDGLALKALGLKLVNTDKSFETGLKKAGQTLDLKLVPADIRDPIRKKAKRQTTRMLDRYINGRLGLIFDTTSANAGKIKSYLNMLNHLGYESKMIYVSTSLDNAKKRNNMRPRKLPDAIVEKDWNNSQKNIAMMKKLFGKDFVQVTNDDDLSSLQKKTNSLFSKLMTWSTSFPNNKRSSLWKQRQVLTKKNYTALRGFAKE
jgi:predicted kinase